jgi:hypothetical protein
MSPSSARSAAAHDCRESAKPPAEGTSGEAGVEAEAEVLLRCSVGTRETEGRGGEGEEGSAGREAGSRRAARTAWWWAWAARRAAARDAAAEVGVGLLEVEVAGASVIPSFSSS